MVGVRRKFNVTLVVAFVAAMSLIMASPASASANLVAAVTGTATLSNGTPGSGTGNFEGDWVGLHGTTVGQLDRVASTNFNYDNTDLVLGTADGTLNFYKGSSVVHSDTFDWVRVGLTAVVVFGDVNNADVNGAALAAFAPVPLTDDALVVGFGVGTP